MNCGEVSKFLQVYVDGELDDEDSRVLVEHLAVCGACRAQADYERRFRDAIRARIPRPRAPAGFTERLTQRLDKARDRRAFSSPLVWGSVPAVAALAVIIVFSFVVTSGFSSLAVEAVERHSTAPPVELTSSDAVAVEDWYKKKVDFNVVLPRFKSHKLKLMGAGLDHFAQQRVARIRYRHGAHVYNLFVVIDPGGSLEGRECRQIRSRKLCLSEHKGYTVGNWRSRGLFYYLVGGTPPQDVIDVLSTAQSF